MRHTLPSRPAVEVPSWSPRLRLIGGGLGHENPPRSTSHARVLKLQTQETAHEGARRSSLQKHGGPAGQRVGARATAKPASDAMPPRLLLVASSLYFRLERFDDAVRAGEEATRALRDSSDPPRAPCMGSIGVGGAAVSQHTFRGFRQRSADADVVCSLVSQPEASQIFAINLATWHSRLKDNTGEPSQPCANRLVDVHISELCSSSLGRCLKGALCC